MIEKSLLAFSLLLVGCGSESNAATAGGPGASSASHVTITGSDAGSMQVSATIIGNDYLGPEGGVRCQLYNSATPSLSINARPPGNGLVSELRLQYFRLDLLKKERDETFPASLDGTHSFSLSATAYDSGVFVYAEPSDWSAHLSEHPACHTSFTELSSADVVGTLSCTNLYNGHHNTLSTITIAFACSN